MAFNSANMGLRVWDLPDDDFTRAQLANNWTAIDKHDHSSSRGIQVPTAGIRDYAITTVKIADLAVTTTKINNAAVTTPKIADSAVTTPKIADLAVITQKLGDSAVTTVKVNDAAITEPKLADGSVTNPKLATNSVSTIKVQDAAITEPKLAVNSVTTPKVVDYNITEIKLATPAVNTNNIFNAAVTSEKLADGVVPVGQIITWFRPSDLNPLPNGWLVADGQTVLAANHDFAENTSITLPDLRNRFILGAATSGTGTSTEVPPSERQVGGSNVLNLSHSHTVDTHSHTVNNHVHGIGADTHRHYFYNYINTNAPYSYPDVNSGAGATDARQRGSAVYGNQSIARRQALYVPNLNYLETYGEDVPAPMSNHTHSHGGVTAGAAAGTSWSSPGTSSSLSGSQDIRPKYIGLLYLIKVKN